MEQITSTAKPRTMGYTEFGTTMSVERFVNQKFLDGCGLSLSVIDC